MILCAWLLVGLASLTIVAFNVHLKTSNHRLTNTFFLRTSWWPTIH